MKTTVSIIIPCLNEEKALANTLQYVFSQTHLAHEIIIVDGGSQDKTCDIAKQYHQVTLVSSDKTGRAEQMNTGASSATGEWLLFLHADTLLPNNAIAQIQSLSQDSKVLSGCFKQAFSPQTRWLRFISCLHNYRCKLTRIMYGDQSIFIQRRTFNQLGAYPIGRLEDIRLSEQLLKLTKPVLLHDYVITDSRKFLQRGVLRSLLDVVVIIISHEFNRPIPKFSSSFFSDIR